MDILWQLMEVTFCDWCQVLPLYFLYGCGLIQVMRLSFQHHTGSAIQDQVKMAEGLPVLVQAKEDNHFKVTVEQLEAARTDKTKVLVLNSPSNPTGMIYSREELLAIGNWAVEA